MAYNFKSCDRDQQWLLPPSIDDWLPRDHLARFMLATVSEMDLQEFFAPYRADGVGQAAFHPATLLTLLIYALANGDRSSRQMEKNCENDIAYRYIMANQKTDHSTLCRFRDTHKDALKNVFLHVLRICQKAGMIQVGIVALDGTKLVSNAALSANHKKDTLVAEIQKIIAENKSTDEREDTLYGKDKRGDELPPEFANPKTRRARLEECVRLIEEEDAEVRKAQSEKIAQREIDEEKSGLQKRGRKPKSPEDCVDKDAKANVTDPESRIMKTRSGFVQGYNGQIVVSEEQIILAADVTQEENDQHQLKPMLEQAQSNLKEVQVVAAIGAILVDAGYCNDENLRSEKADRLELFCATTKDWKQRKAMREAKSPRGRIPKMLTVKDRMERKLLTKRGREMYRKRGKTVEPVFGQIKVVQDGKRCMRRGLEAVVSEWRLTCAAHNLLKIWRKQKAMRK